MKILIIRFSSIGDIVLTTPVVRCIKQQIPNAEIHYLTKEAYYPVIYANTYIDQIHLLTSIDDTVAELKKIKFDLIIDLHKSLRSRIVKRKLNAPTVSFDKLNLKKWILVNFKKNTLPNIHIVDRYLNAAKSLNIVNDLEGLDYFLPEKDEEFSELLPVTHEDNFVAFVIGGAHKTKCLTDEKIRAICNKINYPIILLGGEENFELAESIARSDSDKIINYCGKTNLNQSAAIIKEAKVVITHDTGLMHIAAAFKKKIVSIWGNTVPSFGMYPYLPKNPERFKIIENNKINCRPCSKIGFEKCPKSHFKCINDIENHEIVDCVKSFFEE
ncbi:MAG: glycosyltransferase family 9 protein [Bacteroidota bacterium]